MIGRRVPSGGDGRPPAPCVRADAGTSLTAAMLGLDSIGSAAAHLYDAAVRGGLADLRRMPAEVIDRGPQRTVSRYLPATTTPVRRRPAPVLLVPPLAAPAICFDLRRTCSLAEHLVQA